jgi:hypothetical protein
MNVPVQWAIAAIGEDRPSDWQLRPDLHARDLGADAQPLKDILTLPKLADIIAAFRSADEQAKNKQFYYKHLASFSAWTGFTAAILGSLVLVAVVAMPLGRLLTAAMVLQAVLLLTSLGLSLVIGSRKPFEAWMLQRAEAENARASLFNEVVSIRAPDQSAEERLLPLQLEYFRRFQLDVQRLYYHQRGAQHAAAARLAWWWRLAAFLLVAVAAFPVVWSIEDWINLPWLEALPHRTDVLQRAFMGLGIIASALQGLLASFAVISLDERNAARYRSTAENLDALAERPLEEARQAAGEGGDARNRVLAFVALVQEQISAEHREWIALRKITPDLALDRLKSLRLPPR